MIFNSFGALCIISYTSWRLWNISLRSTSHPEQKTALAIESVYSVFMTYLFVTGNNFFTFFALLVLFFHYCGGLYMKYIQVPPPKSSMINDYWRYLVLDTLITFGTFYVFISGGVE